ncbi:MAG: ATP-binding cassette domain-containing protein [Campylobacterales bacterium]
MSSVIEVKNLTHFYGDKKIYDGLNLSIKKGSFYGILGKNGVGKSTLINILMGYLKPKNGECLIEGEPSHSLSSTLKQKIALLHEGFVAYDFMSIREYEEFLKPFYPKWKSHIFYELVDLMKLDYKQKISTLSFGQKSQVVLGAIFAQDAEILILDDYSMGLDAGYRKLFIEYLKEYVQGVDKTVLITSHIMSDLEGLIDDIAIVQKGGYVYQDSLERFIESFRCYECVKEQNLDEINYHRLEPHKDKILIYTFEKMDGFKELSCSFEDKFLGYVGKY